MLVTSVDGVKIDVRHEGGRKRRRFGGLGDRGKAARGEGRGGTPIVFLHEFAGDQRSWDVQFKAFTPDYQCLAMAARGYPPSEIPDRQESYTQDLAEQDVLAVLDAMSIEGAHLVGLSMGAYTALRVAIRWPDRVRSVVAASGGSGAYPPTRDGFIQATRDLANQIDLEGAIPAAEFGDGPTRVQLRRKNSGAWERFVEHLAGRPHTAAAMTLRGVQASRPSLYDMEEELAALDIPVLLIAGDEDDPCLDVNLWLKRTMPSARLIVMPATGHMLNLEEPEAFNSAVREFITQVDQNKWRPRAPSARVKGFYGALK